MIAVINYWNQAFPDVKSIWHNSREVDDGYVIIDWKAEATYTGDSFFQIKARGNSVNYTGCTTYQFNGDSKLIYYKSMIDIDDIKAQLLVRNKDSTMEKHVMLR